jgi:hypothetical protein
MPTKRPVRVDWPRAFAALMLAIAVWLLVHAERAASVAP